MVRSGTGGIGMNNEAQPHANDIVTNDNIILDVEVVEPLDGEQQQYANKIKNSMVSLAKNRLALGEALVNAKKYLTHGRFTPMLKTIGMNERTARDYMSLASLTIAQNGEILPLLENFNNSELKRLDKMSGAEAQEIIENGKFPPKPPKETTKPAKSKCELECERLQRRLDLATGADVRAAGRLMDTVIDNKQAAIVGMTHSTWVKAYSKQDDERLTFETSQKIFDYLESKGK